MENKIKTPLLQYVFLLNRDGEILTCDAAGRQFLKNIDLGLFYAQIHSIKINSAITNTTILLGHSSYNLRMVPTVLDSDFREPHLGGQTNESSEYIIVLQDQAIFSGLFKHLNQTAFLKNCGPGPQAAEHRVLYDIFEEQQNAIFISNSKEIVVYANSAYEKSTGLPVKDLIGKKLSDLEQQGTLYPLITPIILETDDIFTTMQKLGSGKHAIISGSPIYDSGGKTCLILTCVNTIDQIALTDYPEKLYTPSSINFNLNKRQQDQSIDIIAESPAMKAIVQEVVKVAQHDVTVLLLGESGTGKEVISAILHTASRRNQENFVKINCSSISPSLLESELFGYEAGSFTGALTKGKQGLFEIANNGTLLLDEIGDMPIDLQAKLLRVLQDKEIYRVGGISPIKVNVRILASTNKNLPKLIEQGLFRQDLFYRINVVAIELPALRNRKEDIRPLLLHFCYLFNKKYRTNKTLSESLLQALEKYQWPGNIRELQNVVERLTVLCIEDTLLPEHFYSKYRVAGMELTSEEDVTIRRIIPLNEAVAMTEKILVQKAMEVCKSTREVAALLDVSQSTVMRKIKEHSIPSKNHKQKGPKRINT